MALTLPYPSMNFVPLDVLTAAEQNQLVANIEYIANQFPVTSSNIDWTTMTYARIYIGGNTQNGMVPMARIEGNAVTVSNNSFTVGVTGVYLITYKIAANSGSNQTISFKINGTERSGINLRDTYQATTETYITGINATDVCTLEVYDGGDFNIYGYSWLNIARIA